MAHVLYSLTRCRQCQRQLTYTAKAAAQGRKKILCENCRNVDNFAVRMAAQYRKITHK